MICFAMGLLIGCVAGVAVSWFFVNWLANEANREGQP